MRAAGDSSAQVDLELVSAAAVRQLSPGRRPVVVLCYFEDLSVEESAEILRGRPGTVKSQAAKLLGTLRILLGGTPSSRGQICVAAVGTRPLNGSGGWSHYRPTADGSARRGGPWARARAGARCAAPACSRARAATGEACRGRLSSPCRPASDA
ncbi:sigma factor-like helix-turn-helix DNA-binding protein [Streptomyces sp. H51]|uniref:sigma factor-like helix-turn-helix DNA-binding protein n=1 Tax=Streptomyces sp. H51 TaxID=3111770 RepID=UPI003B63AACE